MTFKNFRIAGIVLFVLCLVLVVNILSFNRFSGINKLFKPLSSQDNKVDYINSPTSETSSTDYSGSVASTVENSDMIAAKKSESTSSLLLSSDKTGGSPATESSKRLSEDYGVSSYDHEHRSNTSRPRPGLLTAGEWNDLEHWEFWQSLMQDQDQNENSYINMLKKWGFQDPLKQNSTCQIPDLCQFYINKDKLDLTFMIDTTGSMGDELDYLKSELKNVVQRVSLNNSNLDIKIATVFYRDQGDEYVVRKFDFSDDIDQVIRQIKDQNASGGGDTPEAADEALQISIERLSWRTNSQKLLFWVADAPIHNKPKNIELFQSQLSKARFGNNIAIIPIASSGVDKATEMLMRATAIYTNGTYVFLTDDSGIGNSHIKPTIGAFQVENLNDLLVRVINERI